MSRVHSQQVRRFVERHDAVVADAERSAQLGDFYARVGREALALEFYARAKRRYDAANEMAVIIMEAKGYRLTPRPHASTGAARVRDPRGRYARRDGKRRPRERRDGARSSARSGDSGSDDSDPEPAPSRRCRCDHPLVLADEWFGPSWCRCLWCGHEPSRQEVPR